MNKKLKIAGAVAGFSLAYYFLTKTSISFTNSDPQLKSVDVNVNIGLHTYSTTIDVSTPKKDTFTFLGKTVNIVVTKTGLVSATVNDNNKELDKAAFKFSYNNIEPTILQEDVQEVTQANEK